MIEFEADRYRDPARIAQCACIAAHIFERHGADFLTAHREGGWSNITWSAGELVLRIAVESDHQRLLYEAQVVSVLPPEVGYPPIVETGVTKGFEWMLAKRVVGRNLADVWPMLGWEARTAALGELWAKARAVHSVDPVQAKAHASDQSPFYAPNPEQAAGQLARLQRAGVLSADQGWVVSKALDRFWDAEPAAPCLLNHGDLWTGNALWEDGHVVALLDLEYAVLAPIELDLNELVKTVYGPPETVDLLPDPDGLGRAGLQQAVTDIAVATTSTPGGADRLLGFALLLELGMMEDELSERDGRAPYVDWPAYRALTALADGAGGYLAPVLARLGAV